MKIKLEEEKKSIFNDQNYIKPIITADDVADVVATMTGIPLSKVAESETTRLLNMSNELKNQIVGQNHAIDKVSQSIVRASRFEKIQTILIGSFMFLGPTGVGKTG